MTISQQEKDISVCWRLKAEREASKLTQQEIADALDVSLKTVTRWEKSIPIPSDKLGALTEFGFDIFYVLTGQRAPSAQPLTVRESCMLENYRALAEEDKAAMQRMTSALAQSVKPNGESA